MADLSNLLSNIGDSTTEKTEIPLPPKKRVIFYNDNFTTMDFVVKVLVSIFNKSQEEAEIIMRQVHENGSSVVGIYTYDIAVSRKNLAIQIARNNGFPLRVEIE